MIEPTIILGLFDGAIFSNEIAYLLVTVLIGGIIGALSRSLAVASFGSMLVVIHITLQTDIWIFDSLLYAIVAIFIVVLSLRIYQYATGESQEAVQ